MSNHCFVHLKLTTTKQNRKLKQKDEGSSLNVPSEKRVDRTLTDPATSGKCPLCARHCTRCLLPLSDSVLSAIQQNQSRSLLYWASTTTDTVTRMLPALMRSTPFDRRHKWGSERWSVWSRCRALTIKLSTWLYCALVLTGPPDVGALL